jgi:uncharacterized protein
LATTSSASLYTGVAGSSWKIPPSDPDPKLVVTFDVRRLVSRRSVVFARAGYGKSNLMKYLLSELYREAPRTDSGIDVGTLIFDADGEYFWPDRVKGRPGLCDVAHLRDRLVVFTNRQPPKGLQATDTETGQCLGYQGAQIQNAAAEIGAARSNMFGVVKLLHDPDSRLLGGAIQALRAGLIVVVDISLLSSAAGRMLSGLMLRRIFSHNQESFTGGQSVIPVIIVLEEAQSVLSRQLEESSPFVEWVKEGRKYDLGAILITQQPGSIAPEILSQADNWFCFHLLSEGDAGTLGKYNAHFSDDVLAHLIAEPMGSTRASPTTRSRKSRLNPTPNLKIGSRMSCWGESSVKRRSTQRDTVGRTTSAPLMGIGHVRWASHRKSGTRSCHSSTAHLN